MSTTVKLKRPGAAGSRTVRRAAGKGNPAFSLNQPEPSNPEISRAMVRNHLRQMHADKMWNRLPPTITEWLFAEWHLAQKLRLSPLRAAFFASEAARKHGMHDHATPPKPARRHAPSEL